jgi:hypothetical protein
MLLLFLKATFSSFPLWLNPDPQIDLEIGTSSREIGERL